MYARFGLCKREGGGGGGGGGGGARGAKEQRPHLCVATSSEAPCVRSIVTKLGSFTGTGIFPNCSCIAVYTGTDSYEWGKKR